LQLLYPGALISTGQKVERISDGTSKTIIFSEVRTLSHPMDERGAWALPWNGASILAFDLHHDYDGGVFRQYTPDREMAYQTQLPNNLGPNSDVLNMCEDDRLAEAQLERMPCQFGGLKFISLGLSNFISSAPRSNHPGGVNAAYVDGHVDFILNEVDPFFMANEVSIHDSDTAPYVPSVDDE
jgi:prepilin-type processing-associated H-X9-DG protein